MLNNKNTDILLTKPLLPRKPPEVPPAHTARPSAEFRAGIEHLSPLRLTHLAGVYTSPACPELGAPYPIPSCLCPTQGTRRKATHTGGLQIGASEVSSW